MQLEAPVQLIQVPPQPTCNPAALFSGADCQDRWNIYNQAVEQRRQQELQIYINRQKDMAASQATAPLQQQIADLKKLADDEQHHITNLQQQMQADATAALQAKAAAHMQGLQYGAGIGVSSTLVLFAVIFGIKKLIGNFTVTKKPQARSASA